MWTSPTTSPPSCTGRPPSMPQLLDTAADPPARLEHDDVRACSRARSRAAARPARPAPRTRTSVTPRRARVRMQPSTRARAPRRDRAGRGRASSRLRPRPPPAATPASVASTDAGIEPSRRPSSMQRRRAARARRGTQRRRAAAARRRSAGCSRPRSRAPAWSENGRLTASMLTSSARSSRSRARRRAPRSSLVEGGLPPLSDQANAFRSSSCRVEK